MPLRFSEPYESRLIGTCGRLSCRQAHSASQKDAMDRGLYIAGFLLSKRSRLRIGALGSFTFQAGLYLYVGSAQQNRTARLERHARPNKPLRWHIDYPSAKARMVGAVLVPGTRAQECVLARKLAVVAWHIVPGFGGTIAFDSSRDGELVPIISSSPANTFYNLAMLPGWQRWMPTYRYATITAINYGDNTCSITLDGET